MGSGSRGTNRYQVLPQDNGIGIRIAKQEKTRMSRPILDSVELYTSSLCHSHSSKNTLKMSCDSIGSCTLDF